MGDILRGNCVVVEMNTEFEIQPIQLLKHEIHVPYGIYTYQDLRPRISISARTPR